MPLYIPLRGGEAHQDIETTIGDHNVTLRLRWNDRDNEGEGAWYFSVYDSEDNEIAGGLKIVLGTYIGRGIDHRLFREGIFVAVDTAQQLNRGVPREATFRDLGKRVRVYYYTEMELANFLNFLAYEGGL